MKKDVKRRQPSSTKSKDFVEGMRRAATISKEVLDVYLNYHTSVQSAGCLDKAIRLIEQEIHDFEVDKPNTH